MKSILIVFNSGAGTLDQELVEGIIRESFSSPFYKLTWYHTTGKDDVTGISALVKQCNPDILLASGGDGTCNLVAHVAISQNILMGIIPAGSANALAKELNIPLDLPKALELVRTGKETTIDYLKVNDRICIRQAEIGVNAQLIEAFESSAGRGMRSYVYQFFQNIFRWKSFSFRAVTDAGIIKHHVISLTFASTRKYGTGALIIPTGAIDDGLFEIVMIRSFPWYSLPSLFLRFFTGKIHESIYSDIISCKSAEVKLKKKKMLQVDGELIGKVLQVNVSIVPQGLRILIP